MMKTKKARGWILTATITWCAFSLSALLPPEVLAGSMKVSGEKISEDRRSDGRRVIETPAWGHDPVDLQRYNKEAEKPPLFVTKGELRDVPMRGGRHHYLVRRIPAGEIFTLRKDGEDWILWYAFRCGNDIEGRIVAAYAEPKPEVVVVPGPERVVEKVIERVIEREPVNITNNNYNTNNNVPAPVQAPPLPPPEREEEEEELACLGAGTIASGLGAGGLAWGVSTGQWWAAAAGAVLTAFGIFDKKSDSRCKAVAGVVGGVAGAYGGYRHNKHDQQRHDHRHKPKPPNDPPPAPPPPPPNSGPYGPPNPPPAPPPPPVAPPPAPGQVNGPSNPPPAPPPIAPAPAPRPVGGGYSVPINPPPAGAPTQGCVSGGCGSVMPPQAGPPTGYGYGAPSVAPAPAPAPVWIGTQPSTAPQPYYGGVPAQAPVPAYNGYTPVNPGAAPQPYRY